MRKLAVVAALFLASCTSTGGGTSPVSTVCKWARLADAACQAHQPVPTPPAEVVAEIAATASKASPVDTLCKWVHMVVVACDIGDPVPPPPVQVAQDLVAISAARR